MTLYTMYNERTGTTRKVKAYRYYDVISRYKSENGWVLQGFVQISK